MPTGPIPYRLPSCSRMERRECPPARDLSCCSVKDVKVFSHIPHTCVRAQYGSTFLSFTSFTCRVHPVLVLPAGVDRAKFYTLEEASLSVVNLLEASLLKGFRERFSAAHFLAVRRCP